MKYNTLLLLELMYVTVLSGLNAGQIKAQPEVTGYVGHDVTLPCPLIKNRAENISQVEWKLQQPNCSEISIIVLISREQFTAHDTFLQGRVEISEQSLIIRDVEMRDAGSYTCTLSAFPSGKLEGTTTLIVLDGTHLSSGEISAIVISVLLLSVILLAVAYLVFIKRSASFVRQQVFIDTDGPVRDVARPSFIVKEQDLVYSDVKCIPSRVADPFSNDRHTQSLHVDDVMYSEVSSRF
ncbi:nectin-2-like isoform X1 [Labrus mixtus]|uniref:nectin-2-like isoform X1 n=2 Tax=Labrus mixtus TaxID=508554 RepID=UPI0029C0498E|nr:nectin-2-like isoform X1 [Labrus mixtus]